MLSVKRFTRDAILFFVFGISYQYLFNKVLSNVLQVIIDSQPLTVAILASLLFGESIGYIGAAGLILGVIGLLLLEVSIFKVSTFQASYSSLF